MNFCFALSARASFFCCFILYDCAFNKPALVTFMLNRNVQLGDCITPVLETQTDEVPHQLSWRKRLETVSTLSELPDGDRFVFDKDTRRWRRRVRYYREVCIGHALI